MLRRSIPIQAAIFRRTMATRVTGTSQEYTDLKNQVDTIQKTCDSLIKHESRIDGIEKTLTTYFKQKQDEQAEIGKLLNFAAIFVCGGIVLMILTSR